MGFCENSTIEFKSLLGSGVFEKYLFFRRWDVFSFIVFRGFVRSFFGGWKVMVLVFWLLDLEFFFRSFFFWFFKGVLVTGWLGFRFFFFCLVFWVVVSRVVEFLLLFGVFSRYILGSIVDFVRVVFFVGNFYRRGRF